MIFFERLNPFIIVKEHFNTLYDATTSKPTYVERSLHLVIPVACGLILTHWTRAFISKDMDASLLNGFAIMGGFLINASFILAEKRDKAKSATPNDKYEILLKETFYNTSFGILVCFLNVIFCAVYPLTLADDGKISAHWPNFILTNLIFDLSILFLLTLLMVLKRLNKIFSS